MARSRRYERHGYDDYDYDDYDRHGYDDHDYDDYDRRGRGRSSYRRHERGGLGFAKVVLTIIFAAVIFWNPLMAQFGIEARNPSNLVADLINSRGNEVAYVPVTVEDSYTAADHVDNGASAVAPAPQSAPPQAGANAGDHTSPPVYERVGGRAPALGPGDSVSDFTDQRGRIWGGSNLTIDGISTVYITTEQARACAQAEGTRAQLHNAGEPIVGASVYYSVYGEPVPETTDENGMFPICHIEGIFIGAFDESIPAFSIAAPEAAVQAEYVQPVPTENGLVFVIDVSKVP